MTERLIEHADLSADYLQYVIENAAAGLIEPEDISSTVEGLVALVDTQGSFELTWHSGGQGFLQEIVPEDSRFAFGSSSQPSLMLAVRGTAEYIRVAPDQPLLDPRVRYFPQI